MSGGAAPFAEGLLRRLAASQRTVGNFQACVHASACASTAPVPQLLAASGEPVVGEPVRIECAVPLSWFPIMLAEITPSPSSHRDIDLSLFGMTGCRLAMDLERLLFFAPSDGTIVSRDPSGKVTVRWTPEAGFKGYTVTWQALMLVPRSVAASERLLSGGLQVNVGAR
jgi:hypothetical protein